MCLWEKKNNQTASDICMSTAQSWCNDQMSVNIVRVFLTHSVPSHFKNIKQPEINIFGERPCSVQPYDSTNLLSMYNIV